jgi:hypothetical protein
VVEASLQDPAQVRQVTVPVVVDRDGCERRPCEIDRLVQIGN